MDTQRWGAKQLLRCELEFNSNSALGSKLLPVQQAENHSLAVHLPCNQMHHDSNRLVLRRQYKLEHCSKLEREFAGAEYPPFSWLAAISFPFLWAPSFGEFGSKEWRRWGREFIEAGIPVKSCVVHHLDLVSGAAP